MNNVTGRPGFGAGEGFDLAELAALIGGGGAGSLGEPIARGADEIIAAIKADLEAKETPADEISQTIQQLTADLGEVEGSVLHKNSDGKFTIISHVTDDRSIAEQLRNAGRFHERHGGKVDGKLNDMVALAAGRGGEPGFPDVFEKLFARQRAQKSRDVVADLLGSLRKAVEQHQAMAPLAPRLPNHFAVLSAALLAYARNPDEAAKSLADVQKVVDFLEKADQSRLAKIAHRLRSYGFHLSTLVPQLKMFLEKPTVATARLFSDRVARMIPAVICMIGDVNREVVEARQI